VVFAGPVFFDLHVPLERQRSLGLLLASSGLVTRSLQKIPSFCAPPFFFVAFLLYFFALASRALVHCAFNQIIVPFFLSIWQRLHFSRSQLQSRCPAFPVESVHLRDDYFEAFSQGGYFPEVPPSSFTEPLISLMFPMCGRQALQHGRTFFTESAPLPSKMMVFLHLYPSQISLPTSTDNSHPPSFMLSCESCSQGPRVTPSGFKEARFPPSYHSFLPLLSSHSGAIKFFLTSSLPWRR